MYDTKYQKYLKKPKYQRILNIALAKISRSSSNTIYGFLCPIEAILLMTNLEISLRNSRHAKYWEEAINQIKAGYNRQQCCYFLVPRKIGEQFPLGR